MKPVDSIINSFMKSVSMQSFYGPYFPVFGLNMEIHRVYIRIQSEYEEIGTRKTPNINTFYAVYSNFIDRKIPH